MRHLYHSSGLLRIIGNYDEVDYSPPISSNRYLITDYE
jgi:hypothetical protein